MPDLLLKHQVALKLTPTEVVVLLNVLMHWWFAERKPYPRPTTIAKRMGTAPRTVQRALKRLTQKGVIATGLKKDGATSYDPTPLVQKLKELAVDDVVYQIRKKDIKLA